MKMPYLKPIVDTPPDPPGHTDVAVVQQREKKYSKYMQIMPIILYFPLLEKVLTQICSISFIYLLIEFSYQDKN